VKEPVVKRGFAYSRPDGSVAWLVVDGATHTPFPEALRCISLARPPLPVVRRSFVWLGRRWVCGFFFFSGVRCVQI